MNSKVVVFDLDDTLINEVDFLESAYREISVILCPTDWQELYHSMINSWKLGKDVFGELSVKYPSITVQELLMIYRNHIPIIQSRDGVIELLKYLKRNGVLLGIITDGRSMSQRRKLSGAGLNEFFDKIIISEEFGSEKPSIANFTSFYEFKALEYFYIGDNTNKDFIGPNSLGWTTVCLIDNGKNIHKQNFNLTSDYLPKIYVKDFFELQVLMQSVL